MSDQHANPGIDASVIWLSWVRDREPAEVPRSSKEIQMTERMTLPVLPLRDFVLLPGVTAPINAGKPATLRAIEAALNTPERLVFAVSQREDVQPVTPEVLHTIGTVARIGQLQRGLAGMQLLLHGEYRGIAMKIVEKDGHLQAIVREAEEMQPLNAQDPAFVALSHELREKLAALALPADVRKEVDRELGRLGRMGREAIETQVIRTYLETITELPWNTRSPEHLDIPVAAEILDTDHYALGDVKDRVLEFLAVRQLRQAEEEAVKAEAGTDEVNVFASDEVGERTSGKDETVPPTTADEQRKAKGPLLLFVGPPGVGKTSVAKSIARSMGREYVRVSLGGVRDEADIRGHRRTYVGAMPGRVLQGMRQAGAKNPVFLLDEVDQLGVSFQGDPARALPEGLAPAQNGPLA